MRVSALILLVFAHFTATGQRTRSSAPAVGRLHFSGEVVPTEQAAVSLKLAVALASSGNYLKHVQQLKRRSEPYFAVIEPILARHHVPNDFKYLPLIESNWKADAVSTAGAVGYWQFMDETARDMGLKIDGPADERKDLRKSTEAAARYIRFLYGKLGSWTLVAAAYNGGIGMIQNKVRRAGHQNYYALTLNEETGYYLYRALAMKELFNRTGQYARLGDGNLLASAAGNPYEQEREQARRMGWLNDVEPPLTGEPVSTEPEISGRPEAAVMDSVLVRLLAANRGGPPAEFAGDVTARLLKAGKPKLGARWSFRLSGDVMIGEDQFKAGDVLYALVDDVDARGVLYLRATKLVSSVTNSVVPVTLLAMNPVTGLAGISLPRSLKADWEVSWKVQL